jgi:hypothetical protein
LLCHYFLIFSCLGHKMSRCDAECPALIIDLLLQLLIRQAEEPIKNPTIKRISQ